jgi:uncharacterized membrane protein
MDRTLILHRLIAVILAGLILGSIPVLVFAYFAFLILLFKIFVILCIIDFIRKTSLRKKTGLMLTYMFIAGIVSVIAMYLLPFLHAGV